jgi:hypothetical protein
MAPQKCGSGRYIERFFAQLPSIFYYFSKGMRDAWRPPEQFIYDIYTTSKIRDNDTYSKTYIGRPKNRQEMCGAMVIDPLGLGAKRHARSAPSGKFSRFRCRCACFLIVLLLLLLGARFARSFRCFGRASRARVPASRRASRAALVVTPVTMSQPFLPVGGLPPPSAA